MLLCKNVGDGVYRDGSFLDPSLDWTVALKLRVKEPISTGVKYNAWLLGPTDLSEFAQIGIGSPADVDTPPGVDPGLSLFGATTGGSTYPFSSLTALRIYHVALTYNANTQTLELFKNGISVNTDVEDLSAMAAQVNEVLGSANSIGDLGGIALSHVRSWQGVLSPAELVSEATSDTAVRTANLLSDTPLKDDLLDISGNERHWTIDGAPTFIASAPAYAAIFESDVIEFRTANGDLYAQTAAETIGVDHIIAGCGAPNNKVWVIGWTGSAPGVSTLHRINALTGAVEATVTPDQFIGIFAYGTGVRGQCQIRVDPTTGDFIVVTSAGVSSGAATGTIRMGADGTTLTTLGLLSSDFALSADGSVMLYTNGADAGDTALRLWNMRANVSLGIWHTFTKRPDIVNWLSDCSVTACFGMGTADMLIQNVERDGTVNTTYPNPSYFYSDFDDWPIGLGVNSRLGRVWAIADYDELEECDDDAEYIQEFDAISGEKLNLTTICRDDVTDQVGQLFSLEVESCPFSVQVGRILKTDIGTDDDGEEFRAFIKTRAIAPSGSVTNLGEIAQPATLIAGAAADVDIQLDIDIDFEKQPSLSSVSLTPTGTETRVIREFDSAAAADVGAVQFQVGDAEAIANAWVLDYLHVPTSKDGPR